MNKTKTKMALMARAVMLGLLVLLPVTGGAQMTSNKAQEPKKQKSTCRINL